MPFKTDFRPGDLVYRLASQDAYYYGGVHGYSSSSLNKLIASGQISVIDQYAATALEDRAQHEYQIPTPSRQAAFIQVVRSHPRYCKIWSAEGTLSPASHRPAYIDSQTVLQRKWKAGLCWAVGLSDNTTVHFILDGINFEAVVHKRLSDMQMAPIYSSLRWIYRHKHERLVEQCVQFWRGGLPVPPPWTWSGIDARLWLDYDIPRILAQPNVVSCM